eukprot:3483740-Rhodomonas_salina.1
MSLSAACGERSKDHTSAPHIPWTAESRSTKPKTRTRSCELKSNAGPRAAGTKSNGNRCVLVVVWAGTRREPTMASSLHPSIDRPASPAAQIRPKTISFAITARGFFTATEQRLRRMRWPCLGER